MIDETVLAFMEDEENHLETTVTLLKHMSIADLSRPKAPGTEADLGAKRVAVPKYLSVHSDRYWCYLSPSAACRCG